MKHLEANKCKDSWIVYISEFHAIGVIDDVYKFAMQNGLRKFTPVLEEKCERCRKSHLKRLQEKKTCNHLKEIIKLIAE